MKTLLTALSAIMLTSFACDAQASSVINLASPILTQAEKVKKKSSAPTKTQNFIKKLKYVQTKPNVKADYFILLNTASWCGPCRQAMPGIVESYKDIKASKRVELIILSADRDKDAAKDYLKTYKAKIPATMGTPEIPGYVKSNGIPNVTIIDKDGNTITNGGPNLITDWKKHTLDKEPVEEETPAAE